VTQVANVAEWKPPARNPAPYTISILAAILDIRRIGKLSSLGRDISEYRKRIVDFYGVPR